MNSFIPWVGGKSQLRNAIIAEFPKQKIGRYIEVFGGAGWVLFAKDSHAPLEVFNDIDSQLVNLYRCVQHHRAELQRELKLGGDMIALNSREVFMDYLEQTNARGLTDIQRAARYFYIIRISYGAGRRTFGCSKKALHSPIDRLDEIQKRLQSVVVENQDFEVILKNYDRADALFYLDPPYFKAEEFYDGFGPQDHGRLSSALARIKSRFVLSYNDAPEIREMYSQYTIIDVQRGNNLANKTVTGVRKYKELIIKNF